jgi:hypothetical protein
MIIGMIKARPTANRMARQAGRYAALKVGFDAVRGGGEPNR